MKWKANKIAMILSIVLIVAFAVVMYFVKQQDSAETARLLAMREEARTYEKEISEINASVEVARQKAEALCDAATVILAYQVTELQDLQRHTVGAIVVDCHADYDLLWGAVQSGREIILTCDPFDSTYISYAKGVTGASAFLLPAEEVVVEEEEEEETPEIALGIYAQTTETPVYELTNEQVIANLGFTTCIRLEGDAAGLTVSQSMLDMPCIAVHSAGEDLLGQLSGVLSSREFALVVLYGEIGTSGIQEYTTALNDAKSREELDYGSVADAEYTMQNKQKISKERKEAFNRYAEQQQKRVDALNEKIQKIYTGASGT